MTAPKESAPDPEPLIRTVDAEKVSATLALGTSREKAHALISAGIDASEFAVTAQNPWSISLRQRGEATTRGIRFEIRLLSPQPISAADTTTVEIDATSFPMVTAGQDTRVMIAVRQLCASIVSTTTY